MKDLFFGPKRLFAFPSSIKACALGGSLLFSSLGSAYIVDAQINGATASKVTKTTVEVPNSLDTSCIITTNRPRVVSNISTESIIFKKLEEAQKLLADSCPIDNNTVGISLLERSSGKLHAVTMAKSNFLTPGYEQSYQLGEGGPLVTVRVDYPNYVNTKLIVESSKGNFIPLKVKYPIIKGGSFKETAYYTPAHRGLLEYNLAKSGEEYINNIIVNASTTLKKSGFDVPEHVIRVAKLLCVVEHIDHQRYRSEQSSSLFTEVLTLYALNRGDSYRYSVSSAGAGGMVQMIPSTYREIRYSFPQVNLVDGFEPGMINHTNAATAMLLYLRRYSQYFLEQDIVQNALQTKLATTEELMAAGYNSNPVRVPGKLSHGSDWKYALPQETQVYLSILHSLNSSVTSGPVEPRYHVKSVIYRADHRSKSKIRAIRSKSRFKVTNVKPHSRLKTYIKKQSGGRSTKGSARKPGRSRR
jgi:hypothetical protein